jgi:signal transduction histidine kinase
MALLESQPRSASVVALESVRALQIRRDDFEKLLNTNPAMGLSILGTLSARLRAADDARKASLRLENQLAQRVTELQTEKQKLLELERLRQDTIDLIVHDLRHPISSIFGAIKILEMVLPEEVMRANQQLLNIANLNCDQLQIMVDSLLDVARMESGEEQLKLSSTNLQQLVRDTIKRVEIVADMENVTLQPIFPDDLPLVQADEEKVGRVLVNLLNNAIKYSPSGSQVLITVKVQDDQVVTKVIDSGPGIPPKDRKKIFDRFAQLSNGATRSSGFGLGLAFCRLAIETHGGRIWVESGDEGVGSQFIFSLPLAHTSEDNSSSS